MSTNTDAFADVLDPKTKSKSDYGVSAKRKAELAAYEAPLSVLADHGIEVPHREFTPEDSRAYPTSVTIDGVTVHLHQKVRESHEDESATFGSFEDVGDDDPVEWTVVDLAGDTVELVATPQSDDPLDELDAEEMEPNWRERREVEKANFAVNYEPLYLADGQPLWSY
jgi:hypothetical protein